jgi:hypothetical protein
MGCEVPVINEREPVDLQALREHGHVLRGVYLDAFARLERVIMDQIVRLELKTNTNAPLSHKIGRLAEARTLFLDPEMLDVKIEAISQLNELRADIVHAVLTIIVHYDGNKPLDHWFGFQNASDDTKPLRMITGDELKVMAREAMQLAGWLKKQQATAPIAPAAASA